MRWKIALIWFVWLLGLAALAGVLWVMFNFPLPGFHSGTPSLEDLQQYVRDIGIGQTMLAGAIIILPPILGTAFEIWNARRAGERVFVNHGLNLGRFFSKRRTSGITVTIDPDRFRFEGPGLGEGSAIEAATAVRVNPDLTVGTLGDEALSPSAPGVLIRPFAMRPSPDGSWLHEEPMIHYCKHYLLLASTGRTNSFFAGPRPAVTIVKAHKLRSFFRGRETEILDRVFRAAGASVVTFA